MPDLDAHFAAYDAYHRNPWNKLTHALGIPIIALSLLGLGAAVPLFELAAITIDLGVLLTAALCGVYLFWHFGLALGLGILFVPLYLLGTLLPLPVLFVTLALGVALQYVGHVVFERNRPAFHTNAIHMLVGPLWVVGLLLGRVGLYRRPRPVAS